VAVQEVPNLLRAVVAQVDTVAQLQQLEAAVLWKTHYKFRRQQITPYKSEAVGLVVLPLPAVMVLIPYFQQSPQLVAVAVAVQVL
jgi:hypothetical protein